MEIGDGFFGTKKVFFIEMRVSLCVYELGQYERLNLGLQKS